MELVEDSYQCRMVGKFRNHVSPITDLASSNTKQGKVRLLLPKSCFRQVMSRCWLVEIVLV